MSRIGSTIVLAADNGEWHRTELLRAFRASGVEPRLASLADIAISTEGVEPLRVPGLDGALPDGLFLRTVAGGTFEATTMRLGVLHALVSAGTTVWNPPLAIERCVDKSMTSLLLARAGLPTPLTWVVSTRAAASEIVQREAHPERPLLLKPLFGSQGKGIRLIRVPDDLPAEDEVARVFYLQRLVMPERTVFRDYRILVCA